MVAVTAAGLAYWQHGRHVERNAGRQAALEVSGLPPLNTMAVVPDPTWRRVSLGGRFTGNLHLGSGIFRGEAPGFELYETFATDGALVLVDRGWVPMENLGAAIDGRTRPSELSGQVRPLGGNPLAGSFGVRSGATVWGPGATGAMANHTGATGLVVEASPQSPPLVPESDTTSFNYMLQWAGISAASAAMGVALAMRERRTLPKSGDGAS